MGLSGKDEWWEEFAECSNRVASGNASPGLVDSLSSGSSLGYLQEIALQGLKNVGAGQQPVKEKKNRLRQLLGPRQPENDFSSILEQGLARAIQLYQQAMDTGSDSGPYVVVEYVPYFAFEEWYKRTESVWKIAFQHTDSIGGAVLLFGDPSYLHEFVSHWFGHVLSDTMTSKLQRSSREFFMLLGSSRVVLANGFLKEPDFTFLPIGWKGESPPIVGEVAYGNEGLESLKAELVLETLPGYARLAYGVKLWKNSGSDEVSLRFLERTGEGFVKDIDFSPGTCRSLNDPNFIVELPLRTLFEGCQTDELLLSTVVSFDLYDELQQRLVYLLRNNTVNFVWSTVHERKKLAGSDKSPLLASSRSKMKKGGGNRLKQLQALVKKLGSKEKRA